VGELCVNRCFPLLIPWQARVHGLRARQGRAGSPLERRFVGKAIVLGVLIIVIVAFIFSAQRADPVRLPGVALDSPFLLDLERAAVVAALVVSAAVFLIRGWAGYFPSKLCTTGAEYGNWLRVDDASGSSEHPRRGRRSLGAPGRHRKNDAGSP